MKNMNLKNLKRSVTGALLALTLTVSLTVPAFAGFDSATSARHDNSLAAGQDVADYLLENLQEDVLQPKIGEATDTTLPAFYDLRDEGVVTPVKFQNPFGSCWGFAAIAACETSILSAMGTTYEATGLDLSEHQLAWFARTYLQDGSASDGEGVHMLDGNNELNTGGCPFLASSLFSSGIGPVPESLIPYRGRNSETESAGFANFCYSEDDDWSLPSDYEFVQAYELIESNELPSTAVYSKDKDGNRVYEGFDASAAEVWKQELMAGRAISVAFCADDYEPGGSSIMPLYLNTDNNTWAHYTFDDAQANHAVCIVGWDDNYPATNFLDHSVEAYSDGLAHQPEGDGAWIVKNSWGSELSEFPNHLAWGVQDENGQSTGYFYISYYDRSLCMAETFTFDVSEKDYQGFMIDQYDYMQSSSTNGWLADQSMQMANVFTAEADANIEAVSCETNSGNTSVTYRVYLLDDNDTCPDDGELAATLNVQYAFAGYHKEDLPQPVAVKQGQRYAVVVTTRLDVDGTDYYELCSQIAENEEYITEQNRQIRYANRNLPESQYIDDLYKYYSKGIVNPGESYLYLDALGCWADFADVVPCLQESDDFNGYDFDNFPVKAYLTYTDEAAEQAGMEGLMVSDLQFADPKDGVNRSFFVTLAINIAWKLVLIGVLAFVIVKIARKGKEARKLRRENIELKEELKRRDEAARAAQAAANAEPAQVPAESAEAQASEPAQAQAPVESFDAQEQPAEESGADSEKTDKTDDTLYL